jgi:BirA family biotin operon repressor/biotin-[acetyl-CoA-carboxylase] ligase
LQLFSPLGAAWQSARRSESYELKAQIKWPNDVLLEGKKTARISCWKRVGRTTTAGGGGLLGIGGMLQPSSVPDPEMVLFPATCIESVARRHVDRLDLLYNILVEYMQLAGAAEL